MVAQCCQRFHSCLQEWSGAWLQLKRGLAVCFLKSLKKCYCVSLLGGGFVVEDKETEKSWLLVLVCYWRCPAYSGEVPWARGVWRAGCVILNAAPGFSAETGPFCLHSTGIQRGTNSAALWRWHLEGNHKTKPINGISTASKLKAWPLKGYFKCLSSNVFHLLSYRDLCSLNRNHVKMIDYMSNMRKLLIIYLGESFADAWGIWLLIPECRLSQVFVWKSKTEKNKQRNMMVSIEYKPQVTSGLMESY